VRVTEHHGGDRPARCESEFEIEPLELKARLERGDRLLLLDVREPHEYEICRLPGARLIPLKELPRRLQELTGAEEIVVHCRSGRRSVKALECLRQAGFQKVRHLRGGILAWSDQVDPGVPKY